MKQSAGVGTDTASAATARAAKTGAADLSPVILDEVESFCEEIGIHLSTFSRRSGLLTVPS
jgi:hypothetical protein